MNATTNATKPIAEMLAANIARIGESEVARLMDEKRTRCMAAGSAVTAVDAYKLVREFGLTVFPQYKVMTDGMEWCAGPPGAG